MGLESACPCSRVGATWRHIYCAHKELRTNRQQRPLPKRLLGSVQVYSDLCFRSNVHSTSTSKSTLSTHTNSPPDGAHANNDHDSNENCTVHHLCEIVAVSPLVVASRGLGTSGPMLTPLPLSSTVRAPLHRHKVARRERAIRWAGMSPLGSGRALISKRRRSRTASASVSAPRPIG